MTARQDPGTGTVTGAIPPAPPRCCLACDDEFADLVEVVNADTGEVRHMCRNRVPCMARSALREAAKNRETFTYKPLPEDVPLTKEVLTEHIESMGGTISPAKPGYMVPDGRRFDPNARPLIIPPGDDVAQPDGLPEVTP